MGKNIKGKECGKGIFQRKDGWHIAKWRKPKSAECRKPLQIKDFLKEKKQK